MEPQHQTIDKSQEDLYDECCDLRLPVTQFDSVETLEGYLRAAYDECDDKGEAIIEDEFADDPIYIGKRSIVKAVLGKVLFFL
jgi:hypothetical protein